MLLSGYGRAHRSEVVSEFGPLRGPRCANNSPHSQEPPVLPEFAGRGAVLAASSFLDVLLEAARHKIFGSQAAPEPRVHKTVVSLDFFGKFVFALLYFALDLKGMGPVERRIARE